MFADAFPLTQENVWYRARCYVELRKCSNQRFKGSSLSMAGYDVITLFTNDMVSKMEILISGFDCVESCLIYLLCRSRN